MMAATEDKGFIASLNTGGRIGTPTNGRRGRAARTGIAVTLQVSGGATYTAVAR